jgi:hypothetical protein
MVNILNFNVEVMVDSLLLQPIYHSLGYVI